ncbi:nucleoside deaminase 2 (cytosine deaminase, guanine deaminase) [Salinarchaeum sp. Harcht-Bsk1]|uniref:amidohydrolase family protein n=1 Tax=Salinarchaeum sp. Harcht-Bsk1 TaxID=1333523 RepID=UPI00034246B9|nr:amidohydrolase family protein [Salinarchaeum sp. Harcht-Bsk1]AGN02243.1 nucleoside deaminase 2 (cytosine deaminase, guanine deaminase) [Salinarchaeum sp. Harcht-Bsk1]
MELSGTILRGRDFEPVEGTIYVEDGEISAIEEAPSSDGVDSDRIVLPAFVNAHTHLGDSIAKGAGEGLSLEELVAPPDGLKHRLLRQADPEELIAAMERSLRYMQAGGTGACIEFREGGVAGVEQLRAAADAEGVDLEPVIMGREEIEVLDTADGYGASGANDANFEAERAAAREAGKPFGIHAGEVDASDVDPAMDLDPDFLVHMVHATDDHLDRLDDRQTPVVVCPRSNLVTDVGLPPIADLAERTTVALGTDNVFLNSPSMFREMAFTAKWTGLPSAEVLAMATYRGAEIAGLDWGVLEAGRPAKLCVLDGDTDNLAGAKDPVRAVVRRAGHADVERVVL